MNSGGFFMPEKPGFLEADAAEKSPCGRYVRYKKILGRGAYKKAYKGFDRVGNMEIAWNRIRVENKPALKSPEYHDVFCIEAILLEHLDHKNIMKCYSYWVDYEKSSVIMITELCTFGNLKQYVQKLGGGNGGGINVETIKDWCRQILQGLQYLHAQNPRIMHRDLKCASIFFDAANGEIKIGDFGLAADMEMKNLMPVGGTPEFIVPECHEEEYNELVDIYAFGMCLIELATSEHAYSKCTNPLQVYKKVISGIKPAALGRVKNSEVKEIIDKCLLPASLRPSAMDLLNSPFFSTEISMEIELNSTIIDESSTSSIPEDQCVEVKSCYIPNLILSEIYAFESSISEYRCVEGESCEIPDLILLEIASFALEDSSGVAE